MINYDLFGNEVEKKVLLRDKFIEPPFSILDTKQGRWQQRKRKWTNLGIKSEIGRNLNIIDRSAMSVGIKDNYIKFLWNKNRRKEELSKEELELIQIYLPSNAIISIFDPVLCEILYKWFCPEGGSILDPFAGGSVHGIVAQYLGYKYTGIDIRQEQINSNEEQARNILEINNQPNYYTGDSNVILDELTQEYDFLLSCPPYGNLEVYSDLQDDISNMKYDRFLEAYRSIIKKSCKLLKSCSYACFVVGEIRDKKGNYVGFVPDTVKAFQDIGMNYYNEAILLNMIGSSMMRATGNMKTQKLVKVHQNILVFKKKD